MTRISWANIVRTYQNFNGGLTRAFENKKPGVSDYNRFISVNKRLLPIYLPNSPYPMCIAAPYQITEGSLKTIKVEAQGPYSLKTDIKIGNLIIDGSTLIRDLFYAIEDKSFREFDFISFFSVTQNHKPNGNYGISIKIIPIQLSSKDTRQLRSLAGVGFENIDGYLGVTGLRAGTYTWVHSRKTTKGTLVSSQTLYNLNKETTDLFTSENALIKAAKSYGCKDLDINNINKPKSGHEQILESISPF